MSSERAVRPFLRSWPYWPVVSHRILRRVLPGLAVSAVGDGMAVVAVSWLALQLAPVGQRGTWVAVAVAAYSLPSAAGTFVFGRLMRGRGGAQLAGWNAILRAGALGAIPLAYIVGTLHMWLYVVLLASSSLLESWGTAGRYTLVAELLAPQHHLPANAVLSIVADFAIIVGPALASILISLSGPVLVIAIDAASFAVLAATYRFAVPANDRAVSHKARPSGAAGIGVIRHDSRLLGLLALSFGFFFLFGPVYVALPVHVAEDLHASATVLAAYYTAFAVGSVIGGLGTGCLRRWSLPHTVIGIVLGFGAAMLPLVAAAHRHRHRARIRGRDAAAGPRRARWRGSGVVRHRRHDLGAVHVNFHGAVPAQCDDREPPAGSRRRRSSHRRCCPSRYRSGRPAGLPRWAPARFCSYQRPRPWHSA
jgi:MFS transporter, DHA3 family, macrolide efflux protein